MGLVLGERSRTTVVAADQIRHAEIAEGEVSDPPQVHREARRPQDAVHLVEGRLLRVVEKSLTTFQHSLRERK